MLKVRLLPDDVEQKCHECGKVRYELDPWGPWDDRQYVELRGVIGCVLINTIVCPACCDQALEDLYRAAGWSAAMIADEMEYLRDERRGAWLALQPDRDLIETEGRYREKMLDPLTDFEKRGVRAMFDVPGRPPDMLFLTGSTRERMSYVLWVASRYWERKRKPVLY